MRLDDLIVQLWIKEDNWIYERRANGTPFMEAWANLVEPKINKKKRTF